MTSGDSYTIVGSVTDIVGFSSPTSSAHFTYNTTPVSSVVITTPTNGGFYGQNWRGSIAGTAASANGISSVSVVLEDASTGEFWNGSSFTPSYAAVTASGGTAWSVSVPGAAMNTLNAGDVLYITARASDSYGNSASTATVFTYDNTAPNESQDAFDPLGEYGPNTWPGTMTGTSSAAAAGASLGANSTSLVTADTSSGTFFTGSGWAAPTSVTDGAATGTSTTLDVTSTAGYPSTGRLWVVTGSGLELDSYSGTTATSFTGVTLVTGDGGWTIPAPGTVSGTGMSGTSTTLNVTSTAGYPTAGTITVPSSGGTLVFSYDSKTATSFTSLALVSGDPTWTIANGTAFGASVLPATVATGTATWSYDGLTTSYLSNNDNYLVFVDTTDTLGNESCSVDTTNSPDLIGGCNPQGFTYNSELPTSSVTYPATTTISDAGMTGLSSTLLVTSTSGLPSSGVVTIPASGGNLVFAYAGITSSSLTGVSLQSGTASWTITSGAPVSLAYGANWSGAISGTMTEDGNGAGITDVDLVVKDTTGSKYLSYGGATPAYAWSSGTTISNAASGNTSTLTVVTGGASTYPSTGDIAVSSPQGTLVFSYTGIYGRVFGGLTLVDGWGGWTIPVGATVTPVIVPSTTSITNGLTWSESLAAANLTSGHLYSLSAIGYDLAANITTGTGGFFYSTSAPTVAITSPASTTVFGPPSTPTVNISGTTAPATGLGMASIAYTLEDTTASASIGNVCGSGVSPCYWNGTGWQGSVSSATPAGVASWSTSGLTAPSFLNGHNYSLTASATDSGGNVATASAVTFTPSNLLAATGTRVTITGTATDSSGALYEIGYYSGGNMTVGGTTLTVPYGGDQVGFVAKYTSNGAFAWARAFGGSTLGLTTVTTGGIAVDSAGYIDIDGSFSSGALSATGTGFVNLALSKTGTTDGFIAQLTSTGSKSWAKDVGGSGSTVTMSGITAAPSGSSNFVVATGTLSGGNLSGPVTMTRTGTQDALIFECSAGHGSSSTLSYSAHYGVTSGSVSLAGVKTDSSGNVYVDGTTTKTLPAGTLGSSALTVTGSTDGLVAELSSALAVSWARVLGGTSTAMNLGAIGIDPSGNVDVGGNFSGSSTSGTTSGTYINLGLTLTGTKDGMVFQLTNSGGLSWAKDIGASSVTTDTSGLAVDSSGNVDFAGSSNGTLVVGGTTYSLLGTNDVVGGQFSSAGVLRSFFRAGGTSASVVSTQGNAGAISVDGNGFAYDAISASGGGLNFNGATQSFSGTQYGVLARIL